MASEARQMYLQCFIQEGAMAHQAAVNLYQTVCGVSGGRADESDFPAFISALNRQLKPLKMELAHGRMEDSGERWYALVNRSPDQAARLSCSYSAAELELFNEIMKHLVFSQEGTGEKTDLVRLAGALERKLSFKDAESFIKKLEKDKWLQEVAANEYGPGPRFILELRPFLRDIFGSAALTDCHICSEPVIRGRQCSSEDCSVSLHLYCLNRLAGGRESFRCPGCHSNWPH